MNLTATEKLRGVLDLLLAESSRINLAKPTHYWYPLAMATVDVEEILEALDSMVSFRTSMWEKTATFEDDFAQYVGAKFAVMVNSGSSADLLLNFALTQPNHPVLPPGSEILVPVVTWPTQIWSSTMAGLSPIFVDLDVTTLNMDLDDLEAQITPQTRALSLVHLLGNPLDMLRVMKIVNKHHLVLIEDCCEALGATFGGEHVGLLGAGGTFSFFFSHHITTMEGGMVVTNDKELDHDLRVLRAHGWTRDSGLRTQDFPDSNIDPRYCFTNIGFNLRPTEVQAAYGIHQLRKLPAFNARRYILADRFFEFLATSPHFLTPHIVHNASASWLALPVTVATEAPFTKDRLVTYLEKQGVETRPLVAGNLARQPVAEFFPTLRQYQFPGADFIHERSFYIGLSPMCTDAMMDRLIETFTNFLGKL